MGTYIVIFRRVQRTKKDNHGIITLLILWGGNGTATYDARGIFAGVDGRLIPRVFFIKMRLSQNI